MSHAAWDIYAEQLTHLGYGYPLWVPDPAPGRGRVEIGDVGWVEEGEFHVMFNTLRESGEGTQPWNSLPENFVPLDRARLAISGPREKISQTVLCSRSIQQRDLAGGLGVGGSVTSTASGAIDFAFRCRGDSGALLMLSPYATTHDILSKRAVTSYIEANSDSWFHFARNELGLDLREEDIRFVIGTKMTSQWAVAAFRGCYRNKQGSVTGGLPGAATTNLSLNISDAVLPSSHYRVGPPERRLGQVLSPPCTHQTGPGDEHSEPNTLSEALPFDQCVFVVTCRRKKRLQTFLRRLRAGAGPDELPGGPREPELAPQLQVGSVESEEEEMSSSPRSQTTEYVIDPSPNETIDPVEMVLSYILRNSDARTAIASEMDIYQLCGGRAWESHQELEQILEQMNPRVDVDQDGVGTIVHVDDQLDPILMSVSLDQDLESRSDTPPLSSYERSSTLHRDSEFPSTIPPPEPPALLWYEINSWWFSTPATVPTSWEKHRKGTIPTEQERVTARVRERVAKATTDVHDNTGGEGNEPPEPMDAVSSAQSIAAQVREAARILQDMWHAVEFIATSRMVCLRLTERSATILMSVREELADAGDDSTAELQAPIARLVESFRGIYHVMQRVQGPYIGQYLHHDRAQRALVQCYFTLSVALGMFPTPVMVRILQYVLQDEEQHHSETSALLDSIAEPLSPLKLDDPLLDSPEFPLISSEPLSTEDIVSRARAGTLKVLGVLLDVAVKQNQRDMVYDADDLRQLMRVVVQAKDTVKTMDLLTLDGVESAGEALQALERYLLELERSTAQQDLEDIGMGTSDTSTITDETEGLMLLSKTETTGTGTISAISVHDTLDEDFVKMAINTLRPLCLDEERPLCWDEAKPPEWAITRYEVIREQKIGTGSSGSVVYLGKWHKQTVAVKVLPTSLWRREAVHELSRKWRSLKHPNVLELLGASGGWSPHSMFFVTPYYHKGTLVSHLKQLTSTDGGELLKILHQIASGMEYLHDRGVLHGNLKAANVLVTDDGDYVVSDFSQHHVCLAAGMSLPRDAVRWHAPERMSSPSRLTQQVDVYAFAITCVEVLTQGARPWTEVDDDEVRNLVLGGENRPVLPAQYVWSAELKELLHACWHRDASMRPSFTTISHDVHALQERYGLLEDPAVKAHRAWLKAIQEESPDMQCYQPIYRSPRIAPVPTFLRRVVFAVVPQQYLDPGASHASHESDTSPIRVNVDENPDTAVYFNTGDHSCLSLAQALGDGLDELADRDLPAFAPGTSDCHDPRIVVHFERCKVPCIVTSHSDAGFTRRALAEEIARETVAYLIREGFRDIDVDGSTFSFDKVFLWRVKRTGTAWQPEFYVYMTRAVPLMPRLAGLAREILGFRRGNFGLDVIRKGTMDRPTVIY